jgi:hypothetical protein
MRPRTLALALVAALAACQPGQSQRPPRALSRQAPRIAAVVAAAAQVIPAAYQLEEVDRLRVDLPWLGPGHLRAARVDVTTPRGWLYAQLPVEVQLDASGGGTATAVLEVRGTPIDGYHMVGTWRFALVDGGEPPLSTMAIDLQ